MRNKHYNYKNPSTATVCAGVGVAVHQGCPLNAYWLPPAWPPHTLCPLLLRTIQLSYSDTSIIDTV